MCVCVCVCVCDGVLGGRCDPLQDGSFEEGLRWSVLWWPTPQAPTPAVRHTVLKPGETPTNRHCHCFSFTDQKLRRRVEGIFLPMCKQLESGRANRSSPFPSSGPSRWSYSLWAVVIVVQSLICVLTLCNLMDCSTPVFPVLHHYPEFVQIHVHWIDDAIQPSYPLSPPSPPAFNLSQHESALCSGGQSIRALASASVLPTNTQGWFPLGLTGLISLLSKGLSRVSSNTTVQKHPFFWCSAFFMVQLPHLYMTTGKTITLTFMDLCWQSEVSAF